MSALIILVTPMPAFSLHDRNPRGLRIAACALFAAVILGGSAVPSAAQDLTDPGLTIYMQNTALVRVTVDQPIPAGEQSLRVEGLPGNLDPASLVVLAPDVTLLGVHGQRNYQSARDGNAVSIVLDLEARASRDGLRLAYLTHGMSWSPSYSMIVAADDASARIDGYATVMNNSGTAYPDADVQLLAGSVNVGGGAMPFAGMMQEAARMSADMAAAPQLSGQAFSGYHLYDVDVPLSLQSGESRRIRLLGAASVPVTREYVLAGGVEY
ncbi:MAG: hypothetical protein HKN17_03385, partial [Rhodothermales bacterium]|nr:hypothetical protein [Rhodothermales bacterium]